jgi:hypothetical protein
MSNGVLVILLAIIVAAACLVYNSNVKGQKHIIIPVYHGLCDQMKYYVVGKRLQKLGYKVKYDISWYQDRGSCDEKASSPYVRTFQLLKAFPGLDFDIATKKEIEKYKRNFVNPCNTDANAWMYFVPSVRWTLEEHVKKDFTYLQCDINGWHVCIETLFARFPSAGDLQKYFHISEDNYKVLDERNREILEKIQKSKCSVGVHVRRGDHILHGPLTSSGDDCDYYVKVINAVLEKFPNASFFFFSEEPQYVDQEILPKLDPSVKVEIVGNDANKCYMDLLLLAACNHQIPSRGAMGLIAFALNNHPDKKLFGSNRTRILPEMSLDITVQE